MKIVFAGTTLFDQELPSGASVLRIEGVPQIETDKLFEGGSIVPLARGGRERVLPLTVATEFASQRLAEEYWLEHYDDLADSGTLTFTCGYTGDTSTRTVDAILAYCVARLATPMIVEVDYRFILAGAVA